MLALEGMSERDKGEMEKDGEMEKAKKLLAICAKYELPRSSPADKRNGKGQKVSFTMYFLRPRILTHTD